MQRPLYAQTIVESPMNHTGAAKILHQRLAFESVRNRAMTKPKRMCDTPMVRTKKTRGLLPLQMDHRTKLGCDCPRRAVSAIFTAGRRAEGCVVCCRA